MNVCELYRTLWEWLDDGFDDKVLNEVEQLLRKFPEDVDLNYIHLEALLFLEKEMLYEDEKPRALQSFRSVVSRKEEKENITAAKAYAYWGAVHEDRASRIKYFDKAKSILERLNNSNKEVQFLQSFVDIARKKYKPHNILINVHYQNIFNHN